MIRREDHEEIKNAIPQPLPPNSGKPNLPKIKT